MELKKLQLKVQALLQKVSSLVTRYENELADLRVEYTIEIDERDKRIEELGNEVARLNELVTDYENRDLANKSPAEEDQDYVEPLPH